MSKTILVGVTGLMGSGKTTFAEYLLTEGQAMHFKGQILPFAEPLKNIAKQMGWNGKKDERGRRLLQLLGTDCGRECIDKNLWVQQWLKGATEIVEGSCLVVRPSSIGNIKDKPEIKFIVADDCRFSNEAAAITTHIAGGFIIRITGRSTNGHAQKHVSEHGVDPGLVYANIPNTGTFEDLREKAKEIFHAVIH
jgi:hypothetical protein